MPTKMEKLMLFKGLYKLSVLLDFKLNVAAGKKLPYCGY